MHMFLKEKIDFKITVIEQFNNKPFNRANLLNIGFDLTKDSSDYVCFHDVDTLPVSNTADYSYSEDAVKVCAYISHFNFVKRPVDEMGGVVLFDNQKFISINGFSTEYWGWGVEDNDLSLRCQVRGVKKIQREGIYLSLWHTPTGDTNRITPATQDTEKNRAKFQEISENKDKLFSTGLSTLKYEVIKKEENELYTLYKVDF
tara:strand:- start:67 stop:672 length:606 start_codon:yes stop_codon:yes gene_type:complete